MLDLILNAATLSSLLIIVVIFENYRAVATSPPGHLNYVTVVSRSVLITLMVFPATTLARLRAAERVLRQMGTKLLFYSGIFSGRPYLSEIVMSALVSIAVLGSFAARRLIHRLARRGINFKVSGVGN